VEIETASALSGMTVEHTNLKLRHLDLIKQVGMAVQHFEQLHQGQWRFGLTVLVAGEGIDATGDHRVPRSTPPLRKPDISFS